MNVLQADLALQQSSKEDEKADLENKRKAIRLNRHELLPQKKRQKQLENVKKLRKPNQAQVVQQKQANQLRRMSQAQMNQAQQMNLPVLTVPEQVTQ